MKTNFETQAYKSHPFSVVYEGWENSDHSSDVLTSSTGETLLSLKS